MPRKNEAWGIEVGSQAIKAMKLSKHGNTVHLEDFDVITFKQILTTPDINAEEAVRVALDGLAQKHDLDKSQVVVSVPGHMAFARFAKLPPVEPSKVQGIVEYEARQQIPFPIEQVEWDFQVFAQEDAPDVEVGIFAITKERVAQFLSNYRAVDLRVDALTLSPVAVYNAFSFESAENDEGKGTVYLDIGTVSTDIIIVEAGGIWLRTLPLGGNHFTEALMKQFKISFARAEKLKREASTSKYAKQIFQAMRGVFSDLVQEIQRSLGFYQSLNRDSELEKVIGVGSTWKLPGLQKYLKQHLQMEVSRPDHFERLEVDGKRASDFSAHAMNMATAYGLAIQGLGMEAVSANVLPQTILIDRMWKKKQPVFAAAAACVGLAAGVTGVAHLLQSSSYDTIAKKEGPQIQKVIGQANSMVSQIANANEQSLRPEIENYRRPYDYRDLYPSLYEDASRALLAIQPQPELLSIDPEDARAIPRAQRNIIWVERIATSYHVPPGTEGEHPTDMATLAGGTIELFKEPAEEGGQRDAPTIRVEISGYTPLPEVEAITMLEDKFIQWYRDNAAQPDRPYEYIVKSEYLVQRRPRGRTSTRPGGSIDSGGGSIGGGPSLGGGRPGGGRPSSGGGRPSPGGGFPGLGGELGGQGLGGPSIGGGTGTDQERETPSLVLANGDDAELTANGWKIEDLWPMQPLADEDQRDDTYFTVTFELMLLPPDQARRTIAGSNAAPAEDNADDTNDPTDGGGDSAGLPADADSQTATIPTEQTP